MKIYVICPVRKASGFDRAALEAYADILEEAGHRVHLPHRDTDQIDTAFEICLQNGAAIAGADEIHIFWDKTSEASPFDLGMTFAMDAILGHKKKIRVLQLNELGKFIMPAGESMESLMEDWIDWQEDQQLYNDDIYELVGSYQRK